MSVPADIDIHHLTPADVSLMQGLLTTFGEAFDDVATYGGNRPGAAYLERLLGSDSFIALAASRNGTVVGGLAAYELQSIRMSGCSPSRVRVRRDLCRMSR